MVFSRLEAKHLHTWLGGYAIDVARRALRPRPAVLWLMGSGTGEPLFADYHWSDLKIGR